MVKAIQKLNLEVQNLKYSIKRDSNVLEEDGWHK